ncbi:hypothetical protein FH972_012990 [Carpinus fangiana]|uniref:Uncharacterized protein n=1 Tax=Carpinus fangiana TaxID=176857 RepID=A0A5N6R5C1_9ROSI|nr:hypothetical protein FH972_012990 [Carpinus fangiana]
MEVKDSLSTPVLENLDGSDNYVDWSIQVQTYLMGKDLWDTIEATTKPPKQEDNEAAFKAWSDKNYMALRLIKDSCVPSTSSEIGKTSYAKDAWNTLAEKKEKRKGWQAKYSYVAEVEEEIFCLTMGLDTMVAQNWNQINVIDHEAFKVEFEEVVRRGDWNSVEEFMNRYPGSAGLKITGDGGMALHVAVDAEHEHIVEKLVAIMSEQELEITNNDGATALAEMITWGKNPSLEKWAECMLRRNVNLLRIKCSRFGLPVVRAFCWGQKKLGRYLYSLTPAEDLKPEIFRSAAILCWAAIWTQNLDIALDLIERCPSLALARGKSGHTPLHALAFASPSENWMVFWKRWIYKC